LDRRQFIKTTAALASVPLALKATVGHAEEDAFWKKIISEHDVSKDYINLDAGRWGIMVNPVLEEFIRRTRLITQNSSYYARNIDISPELGGQYREENKIIPKVLAASLGVGEDEIALTRNATEGLQHLISGYNLLKSDDTVIISDLDYGSVAREMEVRTKRDGVNVFKIILPEPATYQNIIDAYEKALIDNPKTKLLLLTHISHKTGLCLPVKEITKIAKSRGADVILDAAHSWWQMDFDFTDYGVDFAGFNLHKWVGAPLGVGCMYINKNRIADIDVRAGKGGEDSTNINDRVQTGTMNLATIMTVPTALKYHDEIGIKNIDRRLKDLRNRWVNEFADDDRVQILTPQDERMHAGITSFRLKGMTGRAENSQLCTTLLSKYGLNTNPQSADSGWMLRVVPGLYNTMDDIDKFSAALKKIIA
jgi:isopenicillin-N epimerase